MKNTLILLFVVLLSSCNCQEQNSNSDKEEPEAQNHNTISVPLVLHSSLENRRQEFQIYLNSAVKNIDEFAEKNGWIIPKDGFIDSVMIFNDKIAFNKTLLKLAEADTMMELPDTYCAALEKRTLVSMSPEFYAQVFPEGIENESFEKLLTHEIAHQLHVSILNGDEDAMGPIWFYEGFALFVANQFSKSDIVLNKREIISIMNDSDRGSYMKYNYIFRYFVDKVPLKQLIYKAKNKNFNEELISTLGIVKK